MSPKKILIIDNYDSFTFNLMHLVNEITGMDVSVWKNDQFNINDVAAFSHIILSPGPGLPDEAGLLKEVIRMYGPSKNILGVCLGLQAIGEVYGGHLKNLAKVFHGMKTEMFRTLDDDTIFKNISPIFEAGRYHSWVIDKEEFPNELIVTAIDKDGEVMALQHKYLSVYGVQFHPESIMTKDGRTIIENFINI